MVAKILLFGEEKMIDDKNDRIDEEFEIHTKF